MLNYQYFLIESEKEMKIKKIKKSRMTPKCYGQKKGKD